MNEYFKNMEPGDVCLVTKNNDGSFIVFTTSSVNKLRCSSEAFTIDEAFNNED